MSVLSLVQDNSGNLVLHSDEPYSNADFSIFDIDGEGSGSPFDWGSNQQWRSVESVSGQEYDPDNPDSFWEAQQAILKECAEKGIDLPDHAEIW